MRSSSRPKIFYGWVVVVVALLMNIAASPLNAVSFSFFVAPMTEDLGWSRGAMALALTFRLGVAGISAPLMGILVDAIGSRALGTLAGIIAGLCLIGIAFINQLWMFYLLFAISGLSGFGAPAGQLLTTVPVSKWFVKHRGRALAIASVGMPLGTAIYVPLVQALIAGAGYGTAWAVSGVLVLILAVPACALFMRKDPESIGLRPDGASPDDLPVSQASPAPRPARPVEDDWTLQEALHSRAFWTILASIGLAGLVLQGTLVYRTSYWEDIGIAPEMVAIGTAVDPLTVVFSGLFFGFLAERVASRRLGLIGMIGMGCSMIPLLLADGGLVALFAHNFLWGAFAGANITVNNVIWPDYFGRRYIGTIRGMIFPIAIGTAAASPPVFALVVSLIDSSRYMWGIAFGVFAIAGLLYLTVSPPKHRHERIPINTELATEP